MKTWMTSRRASVAALAILSLTLLGLVNHVDVSMSVAAVAAAMAGANAMDKKQ